MIQTDSIAAEPAPPNDSVGAGSLRLSIPASVRDALFGQRRSRALIVSGILLAISTVGFLVMGYHPGAEDDGIYLTAIKADLNLALFPHDADFFKLQLKATVFDTWMAAFVRGSGIPLGWSELLWQFISIFCIVGACWTIASQIFEHASARLAGVALVAAMFTLPVAGTALYIVDQYLHPRSLATALILFAVSRIISGKNWQSLPLIGLACLLHPMMGAFGISFCCILALVFSDPLHQRIQDLRENWAPEANATFAALVPFGWMFEQPSRIWLEAMHSDVHAATGSRAIESSSVRRWMACIWPLLALPFQFTLLPGIG